MGTTRGLREELMRMNGSGQWGKPLLQAHAKNSLFPGKCAYPVAPPHKGDSSPATSELFVPRARGAHGSLNPRGKRALRGGGEAHKVTYKNPLPVISIAAAFPGAHPLRLILLYKLVLFKSGGEDKDGR